MIRHHGTTTPGETTHGAVAAGDPETEVLARLQSLSAVLDDEPDPAYRARARARLVAMAAVRTPQPAPRPLASRLLALRAVDRQPSRWRGRLTAGLAGVAVGVTGLAALVAVAAGAQPGDPLYDLKRGTEQTQLALAGDSRGQTLLELASTRLEELRAVTGKADLAEQTLRLMDQQTAEGAALLTARAVADRDADALEDLEVWTHHQAAGLTALGSAVPAPAEAAYAESVDLLESLTTRTAGLVIALDCPSGPATVGTDALGPVPGICVAETPAPLPGEAPVPPPSATGAGGAPAPTTAPAPPASEGGAPGVAVPTPGTSDVPAPEPSAGGGTLPTGQLLPPLPGGSSATTSRTTTPPAIAVPLPGPIRICLPPLATVGNC
ncbi:hypothetical protein DQ237_06385 [Blastococcus sp. TF02-8]|uniref:DUF5667 domain-containing protein n=1 Tax=Blastococcus sp. TF02-8 TaxID=2250574 RepID=UPI000E085A40|nr:DUF5667 domain-containing protein [Blastococcus sp. TF02-8]RBY97198.1 hypothetical protein DQ237_06385 [Blastococcus sp. TF02-8]